MTKEELRKRFEEIKVDSDSCYHLPDYNMGWRTEMKLDALIEYFTNEKCPACGGDGTTFGGRENGQTCYKCKGKGVVNDE